MVLWNDFIMQITYTKIRLATSKFLKVSEASFNAWGRASDEVSRLKWHNQPGEKIRDF